MKRDKTTDAIRAFIDDFDANRPFNKVLGLMIKSTDFESSYITFHKKGEFVGNPIYGNLHGGIISSLLDVAGGHAACVSVVRNIKEPVEEEIIERIAKVNTIDIRVDYLRPAVGSFFEVKGKLIRKSKKVAVARMELFNEEQKLVAVGTGSYLIA